MGTRPAPAAASIEELLGLVRSGLEARSRSLGGRIGEQLAGYICRPGKMLRARFCLHLGDALGVDEASSVACARISEMVHNASLLHDDVVDGAELRRGRPTPNAQFGSTVGLLLGDLAFSQAVDEALDVSPTAARGLVDTVREMTVGELQEEFLRDSVNVTLESYLGIAARKTGALFEWCGRAMSAMSPLQHNPEDPPRLGRAAGILLQMIDDVHDYTLDSGTAGKTAGQDVLAKKVTLPFLLAMQNKSSAGRALELWRAATSSQDGPAVLAAFLKERGHIEEAKTKAQGIYREMLDLAKTMPDAAGAKGLADFMESMAKRQF
ncbi:MAG: polyprenyl synthetase family protein [Elusimicrobia bacterium]|nr:polyprenyl synthetase family protein [Elusimicrobiota bacterium]